MNICDRDVTITLSPPSESRIYPLAAIYFFYTERLPSGPAVTVLTGARPEKRLEGPLFRPHVDHHANKPQFQGLSPVFKFNFKSTTIRLLP